MVNLGFKSAFHGLSQMQNMVTGLATNAIHCSDLANKKPGFRVADAISES